MARGAEYMLISVELRNFYALINMSSECTTCSESARKVCYVLYIHVLRRPPHPSLKCGCHIRDTPTQNVMNVIVELLPLWQKSHFPYSLFILRLHGYVLLRGLRRRRRKAEQSYPLLSSLALSSGDLCHQGSRSSSGGIATFW